MHQPLVPNKAESIQSNPNSASNSNPNHTQREIVKHVLLTTFMPLAISLIPMLILYIVYKQGASYDDTVYIKILNQSNQHVPIATFVICIWTFVLFIFNIIEAIYVRWSKYYTNLATTKSYSITSIILLGYILSAIYGSDLVAIIVPGVFLYQFLGIQHFLSKSWIFGFIMRILCCTMQSWFKAITCICLITLPTVISLYIYYNIYYNTGSADTLFTISAVFISVFILCIPILNIILFVSLSRYAKSLAALLFGKERSYIMDTFNEDIYFNRKKITYNKLWRARIYFIFILVIAVISIVLVAQHIQGIFNIDSIVTQTKVVFVNNTVLLTLLTLILYFEHPSFRTYAACKNCNTLYLKSEQCQICGFHDSNIPFMPVKSKQNDSISMGGAPSIDSEINQESINIVFEPKIIKKSAQYFDSIDSIDTNCNKYVGLDECASFQRISTLSSEKMLIQNTSNEQFMKTMNGISKSYNRLNILNDYIHVIEHHTLLEEINNKIDGCKCDQYKEALELNKKGIKGVIKLMREIHVYLYHNIQRQAAPPKIFDDGNMDENNMDEKKKDDDELDGKYDDDNQNKDDKQTDFISFGFGSFIYYNLLKPNPKFKCFKEELLGHDSMKMDDWNGIYDESEMRLKTNKAKRFISQYDNNNILKTQYIQIGDILAIKCYTDLQDLQYDFRKSFRNDTGKLTDKEIIRKHANKYYFWGKWLNHAISVYGNKINNNENVTYYHGLSCKFMFSSLRKDFNIPTSVTTSLCVAKHFAGNKGIILQLKCQWSNKSKWNFSKALPVKWISYKPAEQEVLLFGNFNQLMISNIMNSIDVYNNNNNNKHIINQIIIETINNFELLCQGRKLNKRYNDEHHANIMKRLIENEKKYNGKLNNYFAKIFHNICQNRRNFAIKTFIMYQDERPNVFKMLKAELNDKQENNVCCNECETEPKIKKIQDISGKKMKCIDCKATALWECENSETGCNYKLCSRCNDMIRELQFILGVEAKHAVEIPDLNAVKMNALRVQSLQIMEVNRSWTINKIYK